MAASNYEVQSLIRAVALLEAFSPEAASLTIGDLSRRTSLPRSTVHRLVVNLVRLGLLTRDPLTDRYRLGLMLARLGNVALGQRQIRDVARPIMERLVRATGESSQLAELDGELAIYTEKVESDRHKLSTTHRVGDRVPLHSGGTGKCLLAFLEPAYARRILGSAPLPRYTDRTLTEPDALMTHLAEIRARGFSVDNGETEAGLASIAAPVWDATGHLVGTLCVAGPSERILAERKDELARQVQAAADQISAALGVDLARPSRSAPTTAAE